jgi:serine/threonine-protein kinase HipA
MTMEINPYIFDKKIGTLLYDNGKIYFEYDETFKRSGLEISPIKLPLAGTGLFVNEEEREYFQGLPGVFHDSLPDKFGTKIIERYFESKQIPAHELNVLQKLMFVGNKSMGAISYKPSERLMDMHAIQELIDIEAFSKHAQKIIDGDSFEVVDGVLSFMDSAASAGGARAKAVVGFDPKTMKMIYGLRDELPKHFEHWLIKFDMYDDKERSQDYTKLEYLYMTMAKEAGIEIPKIYLLEQGNLTHYMIKRFDRVGGRRVHMHSVAGIVHANINVPTHYSYDNMMRLTRSVTGGQNDVEEIYRRMVFNIISRNQDDHAKNFAFLMDNSGAWNLSPAYDITYAYGTGYTQVHQLSLKGKTTNFNREDLLQVAKEQSIDIKKAIECIEKTKEILSTFSTRAKRLGINSKMIERVAKNHRLDV